jgi:hypothetical protein
MVAEPMFDTRNAKAAFAGFALLAASATIPPAALAQNAPFDDEMIDAFVTAQLTIEEIRSTYIRQFGAAETEEERLEISEEANEEMVAAVNATPGITVEEYNAILDAAATDAELANRLNEELANPSE